MLLFACSLEDGRSTADFMLSQKTKPAEKFALSRPKCLKQQEPTQGAAVELLSWQVFPFNKRIAGNQVATSFMIPCQYGFDVWGLDLVVGLKLHRTIEDAA